MAEGVGRSLLYPQEVNSIFGVKGIAVTASYGKLAHDTAKIDPAECSAVANPESEQVWEAVDWEALSGLLLQSPEGDNSHFVLEAIFGLSSPAEAQKMMTKSAQEWKFCLGKPFSVTEEGKEPVRESMIDFNPSGDIMTALVTVEGTRYRCQLVRTRLSKYVVDAQACGFDITDQAEKVAELIVGRLKEKSGS
ncbi:hypothetical protein A5678_04160 [Mycobacterium sp. E2733]|nr:hypothetical protein A5678_04160 [Mycobacterium sp. E2733]